MNRSRFLVALLLLPITFSGCGDDNGNTPAPTAASQTELLVANNWQVADVTNPNGEGITKTRLNTTTQYLFDLNMQFRADGTVRALDPKASNKVVNGGSWVLTPDNQSINVDVSQFKGNFPIVQLTRNKLILRQRAPVDGKDADINLNFNPSL